MPDGAGDLGFARLLTVDPSHDFLQMGGEIQFGGDQAGEVRSAVRG